MLDQLPLYNFRGVPSNQSPHKSLTNYFILSSSRLICTPGDNRGGPPPGDDGQVGRLNGWANCFAFIGWGANASCSGWLVLGVLLSSVMFESILEVGIIGQEARSWEVMGVGIVCAIPNDGGKGFNRSGTLCCCIWNLRSVMLICEVGWCMSPYKSGTTHITKCLCGSSSHWSANQTPQ